ncbi:MAG: FecR domain-containing protein [Cyanobacteria bacterium P01_C01_bin.120]
MPLTRADVESLYNRVDLISEGQDARPARLSDRLLVGDAIRTSQGARAELRFNDGSLARIGERATFWFIPNTRDFRLSNGTALFLIPPDRGPSNIQTPTAVTGIQGTALVVRHIPHQDCEVSPSASPDEYACPGRTVVMVLTDSPKGPVEVTTTSGNSAALSAGNLAIIENDAIQVLEFNLEMFYETSPLIEGLDLDNPDFEGTGSPTDPVRQETWDGLQSQKGFEGSYLLNPELISLDAQPGVSTSWLLSTDGSERGALFSNQAFGPDVNANQQPVNGVVNRALMSSWLNNDSSNLSPPQASVPGIIAPPGLNIGPTPLPPVTGGGNPTVPGPGRTPVPPVQEPFDPGGRPTDSTSGGVTTPPVDPTPQQPFDPGGAPNNPAPGAGVPGTPIDPTPQPEPFNPGGAPVNTTPTDVAPIEPVPQPEPFNPAGAPATSVAPTPAAGNVGVDNNVLAAPTPETNAVNLPVETVPQPAAANEFTGDVLLQQTGAPAVDAGTGTPAGGAGAGG